MKAKDISGKRFGNLIAKKIYGRDKNGKVIWECVCECGNVLLVSYGNLAYGNTKSCGCRKADYCREAGRKNLDHKGTVVGSETYRLHSVWASMKNRCNNPKAANYKNYGGRGISICDEWDKSFNAFMDWALKNGYDKDAKQGVCTLDRIDVDGNYCPENCRWVDMKTQCNNKRVSTLKA